MNTRSRLSFLAGVVVVATGLVAGCATAPAAPTTAPTGTAPPQAAAVLFVDVDTVLGPTNLTEEERPLKTCVQVSRVAHNEEVVWRVKVFDASGQPLDDQALASVEVNLPGETLAMRYGPHPRDQAADSFWTVAWPVAEDYPEGTIDYTVTATAQDGRTGTYQQFKVPAAMLTVTEEVREIIPET